MTVKHTDQSHEETIPAHDQQLTDRQAWVAPALERLDLRDAMAAIGAGAFDGVGSS